jgi:hypothetical protein
MGEPTDAPEPTERVEVYELALELSRTVFRVIEVAELERFFLRDALDRKSTSVPLLIRQGLATPHMVDRRKLYVQARQAALDCSTLLDVLGQRGTIEKATLDAACDVARALVAKLEPLTIPPLMVR